MTFPLRGFCVREEHKDKVRQSDARKEATKDERANKRTRYSNTK